ncbi:MAG: hypothetical protein R3C19_27375, partial [Planctomycetaceae bacterium]
WLMTGQPPVAGRDQDEMLRNLRSGKLNQLAFDAAKQRYPVAAAVCLKLLAVDPHSRLPSAKTALKELKRSARLARKSGSRFQAPRSGTEEASISSHHSVKTWRPFAFHTSVILSLLTAVALFAAAWSQRIQHLSRQDQQGVVSETPHRAESASDRNVIEHRTAKPPDPDSELRKAAETTRQYGIGEASTDYLLTLLLSAGVPGNSDVHWENAAAARWQQESSVVPGSDGSHPDIISSFSRFFPVGMAFSDRPESTEELFAAWTVQRSAAMTPLMDLIVVGKAAVSDGIQILRATRSFSLPRNVDTRLILRRDDPEFGRICERARLSADRVPLIWKVRFIRSQPDFYVAIVLPEPVDSYAIELPADQTLSTTRRNSQLPSYLRFRLRVAQVVRQDNVAVIHMTPEAFEPADPPGERKNFRDTSG